MAEHLLFVYGTARKTNICEFLMSNETAGNAELVGFGWTVQKYPFVLGSRFKLPLMLFRPGLGKNVFGDIYRIDDKILQYMDRVENIPHFYDRDLIQIHLTKDANGEDIADQNITHECYVYILKNFKPELLEEEYISDYDSKATANVMHPRDWPADLMEIAQSEVIPSSTNTPSDSVTDPIWSRIKPDKYKPT